MRAVVGGEYMAGVVGTALHSLPNWAVGSGALVVISASIYGHRVDALVSIRVVNSATENSICIIFTYSQNVSF